VLRWWIVIFLSKMTLINLLNRMAVSMHCLVITVQPELSNEQFASLTSQIFLR